MAKKKTGGVTAQHKGRPGKRLGIKVYGGQKIKKGQIILRQRGTKVKAGREVGVGRDFTLNALKDGEVVFKKTHGQSIVAVE